MQDDISSNQLFKDKSNNPLPVLTDTSQSTPDPLQGLSLLLGYIRVLSPVSYCWQTMCSTPPLARHPNGNKLGHPLRSQTFTISHRGLINFLAHIRIVPPFQHLLLLLPLPHLLFPHSIRPLSLILSKNKPRAAFQLSLGPARFRIRYSEFGAAEIVLVVSFEV